MANVKTWRTLLNLCFFHLTLDFAKSQQTFFLAINDGMLVPSYRNSTNLSRMECSTRCGQDTNCNAFSFRLTALQNGMVGEQGDCSLVTIKTTTTKAVSTGVETWMERTDPVSGQVRIDMDSNANIFVAFKIWSYLTYNQTEDYCSSLGARAAAPTSVQQARLFQRMINEGTTSIYTLTAFRDYATKSLFYDSRGLQPPEEILALNGQESLQERCLSLVLHPLSVGDPSTDDTFCNDTNPWICEFPRLKDIGCFMDPPVPIGAELFPETKLPVMTGSTVDYMCPRGQKFVNGGISPTATCRPDGYWNKSSQFFPCTGGPDYLKNSTTGECYIFSRGRVVTIVSAEKYCRSLGGTVLTYTTDVKWVFDQLMKDGTGGYFHAFAGYIRNTTTMDFVDGYGAVTSALARYWNDGDNDPNDDYIYVYKDGVTGNWIFYDFHGFTGWRRMICKFQSC